MKTLFIILLVILLIPSASYSQNDLALKKKAEELIKELKSNREYPRSSGYDTLIDLNSDRYKDILIEYYGDFGTGLKNRIRVFLFDPLHNKFKECRQLSNLANPTFYFNKKIVVGYYVAIGGGYAAKLKWDHLKLDSLENIDIEVNNSVENHPLFTISSYNYVTKKRLIKTVSSMELPEEYRYWKYVPIIKRSTN